MRGPGLAWLRPCAQGRDRAPVSVCMCVIHFPAWLGVAEASPLYLTDNYARINVAALPFSHCVCWEGCGLLGSGRPGRWPLTHTHARGRGGGYKGALSIAELLDPGAPLLQGDSQGQWLPCRPKPGCSVGGQKPDPRGCGDQTRASLLHPQEGPDGAGSAPVADGNPSPSWGFSGLPGSTPRSPLPPLRLFPSLSD